MSDRAKLKAMLIINWIMTVITAAVIIFQIWYVSSNWNEWSALRMTAYIMIQVIFLSMAIGFNARSWLLYLDEKEGYDLKERDNSIESEIKEKREL